GVAVFVVATLGNSLVAKPPSDAGSLVPDFDQDLLDREDLAQALFASTGWSYDKLRERTYIVGIRPEEDLSVMYEQASRKPASARPPDSRADGVLVVHSNWGRFLGPPGGS